MGKTLIIAEKPSVAKDIAAVLRVSRSGEYYENNELIISNCIGHLVEINVPESESRNAPHPIIPEVFGLKEIPDTKKQFKLIKSLMHRSDVSCVVNACDAGREGELIFRLSYELAGCNKPMQRMWLQSMTKAGIKGAWDGRKPGKDFDNLADAAKSRSEADWLVGINASRTYRTAIGRVMTPTLALVVNRFIVNRDFVPTDYYDVMATIGLQAGDFDAKWQPAGALAGKQVENIAIAEAVVAKCKGKTPSSVTDESKPQKKAPPFLFDLTSLQREANKRFRMSAQKTLNIAQALYEKYKATSYPRTDSQRLPEDYVGKCISVLSALSKSRPLAQKPVDNQWVRPNKRIFDDSKISDHFAIIPTGVIPDGLSGDEKKVYDLIVDRFISIFYPDAEYMTTVRTTVIEGEIFRASGSVLLKEGWLEVVGKSALDGDSKDAVLPVINPSETPVNRKVALAKKKTKPPALYTEATLLTAMETAGKLLDEDDFVEAMKERGLGTPATRAATIEKLLRAGKSGAYMERQGNNLIPTQKGIQIVIRLAQTLPELISPVLTGEWEHKLLQMEKGKVSRVAFMREIVEFVEDLAQSQPEDIETEVSLPCPVCGGAMVENGKVIHHKDETDCGFRLWKTIAGKALPEAVIRQLMENGRSGVIEGFVGKSGKKFAAELQINVRDAKVDFVFGGSANVISLDGLACPSCKAPELTSSGSKISCKCGFSMWTTVAGTALSNEQLRVLFETGTSEELSFVSKKGESFSAKLKLDPKTGKTEFVFDNDKRNGSGTANKEGDTCPTCKKGKLLFKQNSQGKHFLGCSKYPDCRHFEWGHNK